MKTNYLVVLSLLLLGACSKKEEEKKAENYKPTVSEGGLKITFPNDEKLLSFFGTETARIGNITADFTAPAQVVASVLSPNMSASNNIVLFSNPALTTDYTELLNHLASIRQKESIIQQKKNIVKEKEAIIQQKNIEVERFADLLKNGAATGKDVATARTETLIAEAEKNNAITEMATAETELIAEKSTILEHEANLKLAGFNPTEVVHAKAGKVWLISDIPENQINKLKMGTTCQIHFSSFPDQVFTGKIESFGDVIDNLTRTIKMRITLPNPQGSLRAGMFATVSFGISEHNLLTVPTTAVITVQGKNYAFVKNGNAFERREVLLGQQINNRMVVFSGIRSGESVLANGVMQMKGLSFGY